LNKNNSSPFPDIRTLVEISMDTALRTGCPQTTIDE